LSSHLLLDLQRVCDYIILLAASRTQVTGDIDHVLQTHRWLLGPRRKAADIEPGIEVIKATQTANQTRVLARISGPVLDPSWVITEVGLEDIVLAYMGQADTRIPGPLTTARSVQ
jgi:ABC-2 type transport system ATP-binding protein